MTNAPAPNRYSLLVVVGVFVLALVGVGFLVLAIILLTRGPGLSASQVASPTRPGAAASQIVFVPTTTQGPPTATLEPTEAATPTAPPSSPVPTEVPATSAGAGKVITIAQPANVRSGPGLTYPIIAGLNVGQTAPVVGRDSSAQWFAVTVDAASQGTGWVSTLVATYNGTLNDLPVIQAAGPPPAQVTAVPPTHAPFPTAPPQAAGPTNTPNVAGANGVQTLLFQMIDTTGTPNQHMRFKFQVVNNTASTITYGILAAHTDQGVTADSWHDPLLPGKVVKWDDFIKFPNNGTYQVYLGICYSTHDACKTGGAGWTRLSNSIAVTIQ